MAGPISGPFTRTLRTGMARRSGDSVVPFGSRGALTDVDWQPRTLRSKEDNDTAVPDDPQPRHPADSTCRVPSPSPRLTDPAGSVSDDERSAPLHRFLGAIS